MLVGTLPVENHLPENEVSKDYQRNDYEYSKGLLDGIRAEEELISSGYKRINCPDCGGGGVMNFGNESPLLKVSNMDFICPEYTCYCCHGRGWLWKAPTGTQPASS